mgnify:CR=1 FL=1
MPINRGIPLLFAQSPLCGALRRAPAIGESKNSGPIRADRLAGGDPVSRLSVGLSAGAGMAPAKRRG